MQQNYFQIDIWLNFLDSSAKTSFLCNDNFVWKIQIAICQDVLREYNRYLLKQTRNVEGVLTNKKLIIESSEAKKPHGFRSLSCSLRGLSVIGSPSSTSKFDANLILPANNVGSCPDEPECKLLCVNKISAAVRTLRLPLLFPVPHRSYGK